MSDEVQVMRNADGRPVAIPKEVVLMSERVYRAYEHSLAGVDWETIAQLENYPSARAAQSDVQRYIDEGASLLGTWTRKQIFEREMARLDRLLKGVWKAATYEGEDGPHLPSVQVAHGLIASRMKYMHFDKVLADDTDDKGGNTVVMVPDDDEGYSRVLQAAASLAPGKPKEEPEDG